MCQGLARQDILSYSTGAVLGTPLGVTPPAGGTHHSQGL